MLARQTARLTRDGLLEATAVLAARDPDLEEVVNQFGPPPLWSRRPGYASLAKIILEQQVSQASAAAIYRRLYQSIGGVSPDKVLRAGEQGLRKAGLTRQKAAYCVGIARAVRDGDLDLGGLSRMDTDSAHAELVRIRGIGPWTADVYLLMALGQADVWPHGDLALAKAAMQVKRLRQLPSYDRLRQIACQWSPWRAVAARILWHHYLSGRKAIANKQ